MARKSLDNLIRPRFGRSGMENWSLMNRFGRSGEQEQRWMSFNKLTRPRFGKRAIIKGIEVKV